MIVETLKAHRGNTTVIDESECSPGCVPGRWDKVPADGELQQRVSALSTAAAPLQTMEPSRLAILAERYHVGVPARLLL